MIDSTLLPHLKKVIELNDEEFEAIIPYFKPKKYRKKQFVIQENQIVRHIYFVEKGLLKSSLTNDSGKECILQFAYENWWISDFTAFFKKENATLSVECIEDALLLSIAYEDFEFLCAQFPKMEHFFRVKGNFGYIALQQRILSLITHAAKEKYTHFCSLYPEIVQRLPKQLIANYLGLSRETLSRLQK